RDLPASQNQSSDLLHGTGRIVRLYFNSIRFEKLSVDGSPQGKIEAARKDDDFDRIGRHTIVALVGRRQDQRGERACDGHPDGRYPETGLTPTIENKSGDRSHQTSDHCDNIADSRQGPRMRAFGATTEHES